MRTNATNRIAKLKDYTKTTEMRFRTDREIPWREIMMNNNKQRTNSTQGIVLTFKPRTDDSKRTTKQLKLVIAGLLCLLVLAAGNLFGQVIDHTDNNADQTLRSSGRVNPSTLGLEMSIPLGAYPGRGINVPASINYSSKVWRQDFDHSEPKQNNVNNCNSINRAKYSENAASGWTSSLGVAYIEYTGRDNRFDQRGFPITDGLCPANAPPNNSYGWIKRIQIHLPSGESHELRMNDTKVLYPVTGGSSHPDSPFVQSNWYGTFYAIDGSNVKYVESASSRKLYLPDGSFYDFGAITTLDNKTIRKATTYKDINGNQLTFFAPNGTYPNGYWKDTLNRNIPVPMPLESPTSPSIVNYNMPSFAGGTMIYKFHWKKLKDTSAAQSGLTDFNLALRHLGDRRGVGLPSRPVEEALFHSDSSNWITSFDFEPVFNPIVLTAVELPDGRKYEFSYNVYGEIEHITYPTGGEEEFIFDKVESVSDFGTANRPSDEANRGVVQRDVRESSSATPYTWTYSNVQENNGGVLVLKTTINAPDGTKTERVLHRGNPPCGSCADGSWGFTQILSGMPYESRSYASTGQIISKSMTTWAKTVFAVPFSTAPAEWHPRTTKVESIIYDLSGNALSSTQTMTYAGNLNDLDNHLDVNLIKEYGFTATLGALGTLKRQTQVTYLEYDTAISQSIRDTYASKNLISLPSKTFIKDVAGTVVAKSEINYDESGFSSTYRGNATRAKTWLDTNNSWLETRAKYDSFGNVTETTDAKGNKTTIEYSSTYSNAYPTKVTTPIPDPSGVNGSNTPFFTTTDYDLTTGLPTSSTDVNGQITTLEYNDVLLRPTRVVPPSGGAITETEYGAGTNASTRFVKVRTQIDTTNWNEAYSYFDGLSRTIQTQLIDSNGDVFVDTEYDSAGRVKRVTNPYRSGQTKYWTQNIYDVASRVIEVITPDNAKVTTSYGVVETGSHKGIYATVADQANKQRRTITDALGNLVRVDEPNSSGSLGVVTNPVQPTVYSYDILNNLGTVQQGVQTRTFAYDSLSRLKTATNPESGTIIYTYDPNGNPVTKKTAKNITTAYSYDNFNRIKLKNYSDVTPDVNYFYDGRGLSIAPSNSKGFLTKVSSNISATEYRTFDNLSRVLSHRQITDGIAYNTSYTYNLSGVLIEETYPSGRKVKNTLDVDGTLSLIQTKTASGSYQNRASNFSYTAHGVAEDIKLGNNRWESINFNNRLQPTRIALGTSQNATNLLKLDFTYGTTNNSGNVLAQTITTPTASGSAGFTAVQTYTYDSLNRIATAVEKIGTVEKWRQNFSYDRYGNRNFVAGTTTITGCPNNICNPTVNATNNRFNSGQGYTYDLSGNVVADAEGRTFIYDGENKQKEVKSPTNQTIGTYFYDGDGKRVKTNTLSENRIFIYNAFGELVAEYSSLIPQSFPVTRYLTNDHLGSPRIITSQVGAVLSRRDFMPFGEEVLIGVGNRAVGHGYSSGDSTRQKFTGYERDEETNLDFAQARMHNYNHGRFTSPDPLLASGNPFNPQSFNRFIYVRNNPLNLVDPIGLLACDPKKDKNCKKIDIGVAGTVEVTGNFPKKKRSWFGNIKDKITKAGKSIWKKLKEGLGFDPGPGGIPAPPDQTIPDPSTDPDTGTGGGDGAGGGDARARAIRIALLLLQYKLEQWKKKKKNPCPCLVRFGLSSETAEGLKEDADRPSPPGYPYGVSTKLVKKISGSDRRHRWAPRSVVEKAFPGTRQTGSRDNHYTVALPKPVNQNVANTFNKIFRVRIN